jgi:hypothetical protein
MKEQALAVPEYLRPVYRLEWARMMLRGIRGGSYPNANPQLNYSGRVGDLK